MILNIFRMGLKDSLCLLLYVAVLADCGVSGTDDNIKADRWTKQRLPLLLETHTHVMNKLSFRGQVEDEQKGVVKPVCGIECQSGLLPMDQTEQERILGYETMYENGTHTHTDVSFQGFTMTSAALSENTTTKTRRKRQVYGSDGRFVITDSRFITRYPFSSAVRVSTNCTGVLISSKHVLTAAHCVHNGRGFLKSFQELQVGFLQLKTKRRGKGRRRGKGGKRGRKQSRKQEGKEVGEGQMPEEGVVHNNLVRGRDGGKGRRQQGSREKGRHRNKDELDPSKPWKRGLSRARRSVEDGKQPVFRWAQVKQTHIPEGWIQTDSSTNLVSSDYDYALLELRRPIKQQYMKLGVAPSTSPLARIHLSGFDDDKSLTDGHGGEKVIYRFCSVAKESDDLMYQHCDAQPGATGAGVYIRLRQEAGDVDRKGKWQRRVIGVFSGHQWVEMEGGELRDFNVAVRITPPKYAQICHWVHGDPNQCKEV